MHIQLVSTDKTLYRLCRETLAGYRRNDWTLNMGAAPDGGYLSGSFHLGLRL